MKAKSLIIAGIILIAILLAIFAYLLIFGTPKTTNEVFTNLGLAGDIDNTIVTPPVLPIDTATTTPTERPRLRQLTTRPVAGYVEVLNSSDQPNIRFVEMGEGNIYQIDLLAGPENRLTITTINEASQAAFSPDGGAVLVRGRNFQRFSPVTYGLIRSDGELETRELAGAIDEFTFLNTDTFAVTERREGVGLVAKSYNTSTWSSSTLFTVPFFEAQVLWGTSTGSTHYALPKPSNLFEGYLYSFQNQKMRRTPVGGFGLTVVRPLDQAIVFSHVEDSNYLTKHRELSTEVVTNLSLVAFPEKCAFSASASSTLWCAHDADYNWQGIELPDTWYKGQISFRDEIYELDLELGTVTLLVDTLEESGQGIDAVNLTASSLQPAVYFINKNDNTLWMYEL